MVNFAISTLALLTGLLTGALFAALKVPIPAPPELPGIMGIVGIYAGYKLIQWADVGYDLLGLLGIGG
jgi:XapX domain-containing protein